MPEKRKDNKGRVLREGEVQRSDGKYMYRYTDSGGVRRAIYSWKLVESDKAPDGKRSTEPLRTQIKRIQRDIDDGISSHTAYRMTLNSFYDAYIETKYELKASTRTNYKYMYRKYVQDEIGAKNIADIKYSDIKRFYIHLIKDIGFKPNSMEIIHTILHPVFNVAVRDGFIRTNPTDGVIAEIKKSHNWEKPKRHALTETQQNRFLDFVSSSKTYKHWMPLFTVMLGTGARIGEILGLRWEDCDFTLSIIIKRTETQLSRLCVFSLLQPHRTEVRLTGKYRYLTFEDRKKIEAWHLLGDRPVDIAARLSVHHTTIYKELQRGATGALDANQREGYSAELAERRLRESFKRRGKRAPAAQ